MSQRAFRFIPSLPDDIWIRIQSSPRRLLMLDYDGTLVPFHTERMAAVPSAATLEALRAILSDPATYGAVVSGRPMAELAALLGPIRLHLIAEHGWEERTPDGRQTTHPLPGPIAFRLGQAVRAADGYRDLIERKRCSVVLHTRGVDVPTARGVIATCGRLWQEFVVRDGLQILHMDGGLELRATQRSKGTAVRDLVAVRPADSIPVYVGDDETDEDAFAAVLQHGIALHVGLGTGTSAPWSLPSQEAVLQFLRQWHRSVSGDEGGSSSP